MPYPMKIATCCYCGVREALVLDRARHELRCRACGAPLHALKRMPAPAQPRPKAHAKAAAVGRSRRAKPLKKSKNHPASARRKPRRTLLGKPMRWGRDMLEELWDEIEDLFD